MRKILMCVNATLFKGRHRNRVEEVRRLLTTSGCRVDLVETTPSDAGPSLSSELLSAISPDAVYVCGGDGTVFDVLPSLAGTDIALGVVPFGTGNILAQNLKFARDPLKTAAALMGAAPHRIRLGKISLMNQAGQPACWLFMCAAGVGPHAAVLSAASQRGKQLVGKSAYWVAGMQLLLSQVLEPFEIEVTTSTGITSTSRVCEAMAIRVGELNVWRPGGMLKSHLLRLATVPATTQLSFAGAISRALSVRGFPAMASEPAYDKRTSPAGDRTRPKKTTAGSVSVLYQDIVRVVCRLLPDYKYKNTLLVQADGEVLGSPSATIEMSDKSVKLLFSGK